MLKMMIVDANERMKEMDDMAQSIVSRWIKYECDQAGFQMETDYTQADILLLVFSGVVHYRSGCISELKRLKIQPFAEKRQMKPYIVTGGAIAQAPHLAMELCDALAVGEAYSFVRKLIDLCKKESSIEAVREWVISYEYAIERSQMEGIEVDPQAPWLWKEKPPILAKNDQTIDWEMPPIKADDGVIRVLGSKGCHNKCLFCATSWGQKYQVAPDQYKLAQTVNQLESRGHKTVILSNDSADLEAFKMIKGKLTFQSFTVKSIRDPENINKIMRHKPSMTRLGVEGASERIRKAVNKYVTNDELVDYLHILSQVAASCHLFFIVGLPFEQTSDWMEMRELYKRIHAAYEHGICRFKFTAFNPSTPAPIARWMGNRRSLLNLQEFDNWRIRNRPSRHLMMVKGSGQEWQPGKPLGSHGLNLQEILGVSADVIEDILLMDGFFDLTPTWDHWQRQKSEIVEWDYPQKARWKAAEIYKDHMTKGVDIAVDADGPTGALDYGAWVEKKAEAKPE